MSKLTNPTVQQGQNSNSNGGNEDKTCSATLIDLDVFHCPICCDALTYSILQCDEGHIVCSICCNKLRNKCPSCSLPVGRVRCRAMERIMKSIIVPCPNSNFGCTKSFPFGEVTHVKECSFALCSCPVENCNYKGLYKDLYSHFSHSESHQRMCQQQIMFGQTSYLQIGVNGYGGSYVVKEETEGLLFVVHCFKEEIGAYVTMSVIAPNSVECGEFSSTISTVLPDQYKLTFELPKVKRVQELISFQTLEDDFMLVPSYLLQGQGSLKMSICVKKLNQR